MLENAKFLTLNPEKYPEFQRLPETYFVPFERKFFAAQFYRKAEVPEGASCEISVFADTKYRLTVNGKILGVGPIAAGGDFDNKLPMPKQYYNEYKIDIKEPYIEILAEVQAPGEVMTDYSCGMGCFIFSADLNYASGERIEIVSDEAWLARKDTRYISISEADYTRELPKWETPVVIPDVSASWNLVRAEIPPLHEELISPIFEKRREERIRFDFSRIYSAYIVIEADNKSGAAAELKIYADEYGIPNIYTEKIVLPLGKTSYRGFRMRSIGEAEVECPAGVDVSLKLVYAYYPTDESASGNFSCSDNSLSGIYALGRMTLEMCRQTLHLDSPMHQETLGCTGDYAIESLMTAVTFGDMRLSRLDLIRTADFLKMTGGFMFHTSYSLLFVTMLRDYYIYTADAALVRELLPSAEILFKRFEGYTECGIIENPPNYMFIEWGELEGFSMHHPPKALGQTALNAFYQMALTAASELYAAVGDEALSAELSSKAEAHKSACIKAFFDEERGIFFDGKPAPISVYEPNRWLPENASRKYYTRHANILAALCGMAKNGAELIERVISSPQDFEDFEIQPYFMHYLMEAVRKYGLFEKYGIDLLHLWDKQLQKSPKGMPEGWGKFEGDCSHSWGATPTYQLPMAISGFEMLLPAYRSFKLSPKLYSLEWAELSLPTPKGLIKISLKQNEAPKLDFPNDFEMREKQNGEYIFIKKCK